MFPFSLRCKRLLGLQLSALRSVALAVTVASLVISGCSNEAGTANGSTEGQQVATEADSEPSLYRLEIQRCSGIGTQRATAFAIGETYVATVAHSLERARTINLRDSQDGVRPATVVYVDVEKDVAVLEVDPTQAVGLKPQVAFPMGTPQVNQAVTIHSYANLESPELKPATILRVVSATLDGQGRRSAAELDAEVEPGDSGAPIVSEDGNAVGMVFATSRGQQKGWAIASAELSAVIDYLNRSDLAPIKLSCSPVDETNQD